MTVIDPHKAVDFIIQNAGKYAQAKADRVYLEEFRKTQKALLMQQSEGKAVADREAFAYAHPDYKVVIDGLKVAVEQEETLRFHLKAAELRVEIFRTQEASNRAQDRSTR